MSLENKIELLTIAIERLTAMLEKQPSQAAQESPKATPPKAEPEAASITVDDLQSICTSLVRVNRENKPKIKAILDSFNVKVLAELNPSDMSDVKECLEALKNV